MLQTRLSSESLSTFWLFLNRLKFMPQYVPKCEAVKRKVKPWENIHWAIVLSFVSSIVFFSFLITVYKVWFLFFVFLIGTFTILTSLEILLSRHSWSIKPVCTQSHQCLWAKTWSWSSDKLIDSFEIFLLLILQTVCMHAWWWCKMFCCFGTI